MVDALAAAPETHLAEHDLFRKPVPTPYQVRGRLFGIMLVVARLDNNLAQIRKTRTASGRIERPAHVPAHFVFALDLIRSRPRFAAKHAAPQACRGETWPGREPG